MLNVPCYQLFSPNFLWAPLLSPEGLAQGDGPATSGKQRLKEDRGGEGASPLFVVRLLGLVNIGLQIVKLKLQSPNLLFSCDSGRS